MNEPTGPSSRAVAPNAAVVAHGTAQASWGEIAELRKHVPAICLPGTPGHFFKHADEQSVMSVAAIARAMEAFDLDPRSHSQWGIVAAPRYMGRLAAATIVKRFAQSGASSVSPQVLAQYSLHSVAGTISVGLGIHGPNVGLGGGPQALQDGLLAALTLFDGARIPGVWLVLSQWSSEPIPDEQGQVDDSTQCRALALALQAPGEQHDGITLSLRPQMLGVYQDGAAQPTETPTVASLAAFLGAQSTAAACWCCTFPWGGAVEFRRPANEQLLRRAA